MNHSPPNVPGHATDGARRLWCSFTYGGAHAPLAAFIWGHCHECCYLSGSQEASVDKIKSAAARKIHYTDDQIPLLSFRTQRVWERMNSFEPTSRRNPLDRFITLYRIHLFSYPRVRPLSACRGTVWWFMMLYLNSISLSWNRWLQICRRTCGLIRRYISYVKFDITPFSFRYFFLFLLDVLKSETLQFSDKLFWQTQPEKARVHFGFNCLHNSVTYISNGGEMKVTWVLAVDFNKLLLKDHFSTWY